jgi:hypothetical protein
MYRKRYEIERLFRRLKGFRRIFSRFDKLDVLFLGFLNLRLDRRSSQIVLTRPRTALDGIPFRDCRAENCSLS